MLLAAQADHQRGVLGYPAPTGLRREDSAHAGSIPAPGLEADAMADVLITGLKKNNGERYVFVYRDDDDSPREAQRMMGIWASDHRLSFTWYDAAICSQNVRDTIRKATL